MSIELEALQFHKETGVALPDVFVSLYKKRGNGGFGPQYGMLGIISGKKTDQEDSILSLYEAWSQPDPDDTGWYWPRNLVPFIHIGCAIHYCIDVGTPKFPVVEFDPNGYGPGEDLKMHFKIIAPSFSIWVRENVENA